MWQLHRILRVGELTGRFIEDTEYILKNTPPVYLDTAYQLMYGDQKIDNGLSFTLLLIRGLRVNEFFKFHIYLQAMRPKNVSR